MKYHGLVQSLVKEFQSTVKGMFQTLVQRTVLQPLGLSRSGSV